MDKINVLEIAPSLGGHGGIEAVTVSIADECAMTEGVAVSILFRLRSGCKIKSDFNGLIRDKSYSITTFRKNVFVVLKKIFNHQIIHCHYPFWWALVPALLLGKKCVVTLHNQLPRKNPWLLSFERWILEKVDVLIFNSKFTASTWCMASDGERILVVPALTQFHARVIPQHARRGFVILSRLTPGKGVSELLKAYAKAKINHAMHPLHVIGSGVLLDELKHEASSLGNQSIHVHGYVTEELKVSLLSTARWNVASQTFPEDLGMTPIEASLCDVPSIVSNIGGLPEAAGPGAILVEAGNIMELMQALERAAFMSEEEYAIRCQQNREYLKEYLKPLSYYTSLYREL